MLILNAGVALDVMLMLRTANEIKVINIFIMLHYDTYVAFELRLPKNGYYIDNE